ncbi:MAG: hypothetical protein KKD01_13675 [Proteobacteria bacterium]|nr:hypothetical protein [Pseudomonadota bacterium]MBU1231644.1 hypothetical protein [Pseudomonadota bacterium]MBU1419827.1 hypothetical protein [Pseudomonadota bacterium]MBU1455769.1 hypothetical protein [Pseudomonadota bacterium]
MKSLQSDKGPVSQLIVELNFKRSPCEEYIKEAGRMQIQPASFMSSTLYITRFLPMLTFLADVTCH